MIEIGGKRAWIARRLSGLSFEVNVADAREQRMVTMEEGSMAAGVLAGIDWRACFFYLLASTFLPLVI